MLSRKRINNQVKSCSLIEHSTWCIKENITSSSKYSDERATIYVPGTDEYFNEMIYCSCKMCQNRKLKKRRLVVIHILDHGVYIEEVYYN